MTESEIMKNWSVDQPVLVSICCIAYKQEKYISQTIDGFLMQKTEFPFEIIIGEDCGGDQTLAILSDYQKHYPHLIRIVTSTSNIGANANLLRVFNAAKGDYIAVCEGDDYWIDDEKIQKQSNWLEKNQTIDLCFTSAKTLNEKGSESYFAKHSNNVRIFTTSEVVRGGGGFMPTASLLFRKTIIEKIPDWFITAPIGDFYLQIIGAIRGGALYLPEPSVVYRVNAVNSWSSGRKHLSNIDIFSTLKELSINAEKLRICGLNITDISYIKAAHETDAAVNFFRNGYFIEARESIVLSWSSRKYIGKMQIFLYICRFYPRLAVSLINFKVAF